MAESNGNHWAITPQFVTSVIGVIALITAFFWTVADFRISLTEISNRVNTVRERLDESDKKLASLDAGGSRKLLASELIINQLQTRIKELEETTNDLNRALLQHNEAMFDLYRKDLSDGKRDFKIPKDAPKFH